MLTITQRNTILSVLAKTMVAQQSEILLANAKDCKNSIDDITLKDRLILTSGKIESLAKGLQILIEMPDPAGKVLYSKTTDNGLDIISKTVPFGKILIIYESRPDVTVEAAATAFKAGNTILLKGGKESRYTNLAIVKVWHEVLQQLNISTDYVRYLDIDRTTLQEIITQNSENVDLIIPRGGDSLIKFITENTKIPVIVSGRGNNFMYIDEHADFEMAISLILNGKSRPSVCNALDKVLVHQSWWNKPDCLKKLITTLQENNLSILADEHWIKLFSSLSPCLPQTLQEEFLALKVALYQVENKDIAIDIINKNSGKHSAVIVTNNQETAAYFMDYTDCAAVYHNVSTRFTDGGQMGLGAEIAISTQKLHARGVVGAQQLVTNKWFIIGNGQVRN